MKNGAFFYIFDVRNIFNSVCMNSNTVFWSYTIDLRHGKRLKPKHITNLIYTLL